MESAFTEGSTAALGDAAGEAEVSGAAGVGEADADAEAEAAGEGLPEVPELLLEQAKSVKTITIASNTVRAFFICSSSLIIFIRLFAK